MTQNKNDLGRRLTYIHIAALKPALSLHAKTQSPGVQMKTDNQTGNCLNVSLNHTIKPACGNHKYYGLVRTNAGSDKSAAHWVV